MIIPKEVKQKPLEYFSLLLALIIGFISYLLIDNTPIRLWIVSCVAVFYFGWSLYHHQKRGDLQLSIIVEYFLIILIGIVLIFKTLF